MSADAEWEELESLMREFFNEFCSSQQNTIAVEETTAILKSIGLRCTVNEVCEMISSVAPNKTSIDFNDLMKILKNNTHKTDEEDMLTQAFNTIDIDGDQKISLEDLKFFLQSLGEDFSDDYISEMLKFASPNDAQKDPKNIMITLEQYKDVIRRSKSMSS